MKRALPFIFWSAALAAFLTPMELGDVWWHLKTGEWIWLAKGLPAEDPFSLFTGSRPFVLRAFWLVQLVLYFIHSALGFYGLLAMKGLLFTGAFMLLHRLAAERMEPTLGYLLMVPVIIMGTGYDEVRPQSFSFFFFALLIYLLEKRRSPGATAAFKKNFNYALPALMLLWGNVHPGFVIGDGLIALYIAAEAIRFFMQKDPSERRNMDLTFFAVGVLSILFSFINPNGAAAFSLTVKMLLSSAAQKATIHEHLSAREFAALTGERYLFATILTLLVTGLVSFLVNALRKEKSDALHFVLFASLGALAFVTFRAGLFFAMAATVAIGRNISGLSIPERFRKPAAGAFAAAVLSTAVLVLVPRSVARSPVINENWIPIKAAAFIETEALPGNLYHPYEWGGYLVWRLHPKYRSFIDGRALGSIAEYNTVLTAQPGWDDTLRRKQVNTVLYWPLLPYLDRVPPIVFALLNDRGWSPVYWDLTSVIFVRSEKAVRPIRKQAVWELLASLLKVKTEREPLDASHHVALGELYAQRGLRRNARASLTKALELDPSNREAIRMLRSLR